MELAVVVMEVVHGSVFLLGFGLRQVEWSLVAASAQHQENDQKQEKDRGAHAVCIADFKAASIPVLTVISGSP
jgi:hypothetical protein